MTSTYTPTDQVDIEAIERATASVRNGGDGAAIEKARALLHQADRAIASARHYGPETWVIEIVRDELHEALCKRQTASVSFAPSPRRLPALVGSSA